jgi:hypothetical protein
VAVRAKTRIVWCSFVLEKMADRRWRGKACPDAQRSGVVNLGTADPAWVVISRNCLIGQEI